MRHSLQFADERHLMYRASFGGRVAAKVRGFGSCSCVGLGSADGGMVFGQVGQASGRQDVPLAAATVCRSLRRTQGQEGKRD